MNDFYSMVAMNLFCVLAGIFFGVFLWRTFFIYKGKEVAEKALPVIICTKQESDETNTPEH